MTFKVSDNQYAWPTLATVELCCCYDTSNRFYVYFVILIVNCHLNFWSIVLYFEI